MNILLHKNKRDAGQATDIPVINTILHEYTLHKLLGSLTSQHVVDQVRSRTSTCDSIAIRFKALKYYNIHETRCQHLQNFLFQKLYIRYIRCRNSLAYMTLPLFTLHLIQPHNACMLGVAPLFVVLRKESVERNRVPGQQINREQDQIQINFGKGDLLQRHG